MIFCEALELLSVNSDLKFMTRASNPRIRVEVTQFNHEKVFIQRMGSSQGWAGDRLTIEEYLATDWQTVKE